MAHIKDSRNLCIELIIALSLFILINVLSSIFQPAISVNNGRGWDGSVYYLIAEQLVQHQRPTALAPFVYRIGTPFLVAFFFPNNLLFGFKVINICGNLMVVLLFVFWLRLYLNLWITRTSLTACFLLMWHGPVRFVYYYPALTDPWLIVFLLAGLIGISKTQKNPTLTNICLIGLIVLIGIVFREVVLIIPICFLFATNPIPLSFKKIALKSPAPSFFAGIAILILCYMVFYSILQTIPSTSPTFSFIKTTLYNIKTQSLPTYVLACFITYGPVVVFLIYNWRCSLGFLMKNQFMFVYIVMIAVLAWIGGSDIERFLLWGFPVVYLLIGKSVEENPVLLSPAPFAVFLIAQGLAMRIFWIIPDYPNDFPSSFPILTVPSSACQYFDLYSSYRSIPMIIFAQYLVLMVVLLIWFKSIDKKTKA